MKTKAEKYAEGYRCPATNEMEYCRHDIISAYNNGYTQCQEDMADVIKQAIEYGYQLRCNHKPINSGIDWVKEFNSLNKQD